jgi:predicted SnoaL-like aldol condensation-catalyzing enzyme
LLKGPFMRLSVVFTLLCFWSANYAIAQSTGGGQPSAAFAGLLNVPSANPGLERNKSNVLAFYDLMFNYSQPAQAIERYAGATYTQHNPEVPDGRAAFIAYFEKMAKEHPKKSVSFKRVFADGDFVVLHSAHHFPGWRGGTWAAMDIFRLDANGKLVEHWDVLQKVPSSAAHTNGMF